MHCKNSDLKGWGGILKYPQESISGLEYYQEIKLTVITYKTFFLFWDRAILHQYYWTWESPTYSFCLKVVRYK